MTRLEKLLISRRHTQEEISFCWSPFPEERLDENDVINEGEVAFFHDETRRCRADASKYTKYTGEIAFANIY